MDDSLQELENELKALRPRRPSVLLRARMEHELSADTPARVADGPTAASAGRSSPAPRPRYTTATSLRSWKWVSWQMAAAAGVALLVSAGFWQWQSRQGPDAPSMSPLARGADDSPLEARRPMVREPRASRSDEPLLASTSVHDAYRPVKAANVLYDLQDEGPVVLEDNTPARRVRARYVDTYTWRNPANNASFKWSVPRDEVRVLPTTFH